MYDARVEKEQTVVFDVSLLSQDLLELVRALLDAFAVSLAAYIKMDAAAITQIIVDG
jgi:hypothetical protein